MDNPCIYCIDESEFQIKFYASFQLQVNPSDIIILEGILVLHDPRVRDLMNMKIFVDTGYLYLFILQCCLPHSCMLTPSLSMLSTSLRLNELRDLSLFFMCFYLV